MTSRRKIASIAKSAHRTSCAVLLKTGKPPGVMVAEAGSEGQLREWVGGVKRLRYKDYRLLRIEAVGNDGELGVASGCVKEMQSMKELSAYLDGRGILPWWTENMGFAQGGS
ncbi:MAG: hypothetical protein Q9208_002704 [Pyrenodesmia sp. 3 TL-2023]